MWCPRSSSTAKSSSGSRIIQISGAESKRHCKRSRSSSDPCTDAHRLRPGCLTFEYFYVRFRHAKFLREKLDEGGIGLAIFRSRCKVDFQYAIGHDTFRAGVLRPGMHADGE